MLASIYDINDETINAIAGITALLVNLIATAYNAKNDKSITALAF